MQSNIFTTSQGIDILIRVVAVFVPLHQALIEVFKLTGAKTRRYWEALAYIVYGPTLTKSGEVRSRHNAKDMIARFPTTVEEDLRSDKLPTTPQERLIQSFLLRGVGDSPVTDISDSDVKNVIQVIRFLDMQDRPGIGFACELLDDLLRTIPHSGSFVDQRIQQLRAKFQDYQPVMELTQNWLDDLATQKNPAEVKPAVLVMWRNELNLRYSPAVLRAERELPNVLKAAEFQYVQQLSIVSAILAFAETIVIALVYREMIGTEFRSLDLFVIVPLSFGALVTLPRGTKSIIDAIMGLGNRLRS